jgi:multimeric flavodoxin WrbA
MPFVAIVYHSHSGPMAAQARAVCEGALEVDGVASRMIFADDAAKDPSLLDDADALVFCCSSRMGGVSAPFKDFMEATGRICAARAWEDRLAAGFTSAGELQEDKVNTINQLMSFAMRHGMIWISLGPRRCDRANIADGIDHMSDSDFVTAKALGRRVADASVRWEGSQAGAATG